MTFPNVSFTMAATDQISALHQIPGQLIYNIDTGETYLDTSTFGRISTSIGIKVAETSKPYPKTSAEWQTTNNPLIVSDWTNIHNFDYIKINDFLLIYGCISDEENATCFWIGKVKAKELSTRTVSAQYIGWIRSGIQGPPGTLKFEELSDAEKEKLRGPTGPQGPIGPMGLTGARGPEGPRGKAGPAGPKGDQGPQGKDGKVTFESLTDKEKESLRGDRGIQGEPGVPGARGEPGPRGETGPVGPQGDPGTMGPAGPEGKVGPRGPKGDPGPIGPQGEPGVQGPEGKMGPEGPRGQQGEAGKDGTSVNIVGSVPTASELPKGLGIKKGDGYITEDNGHLHVYNGRTFTDVGNIRGPAGPQGLPGEKGATGPVGPEGKMGPTGPRGEPGAQGIQGLTGPQGPQGLTGERGPTGEKGAPGEQGPQGLPGETGPKGDPGQTGPQGATGLQGEPGPRGEKGERGPQGEIGPMGEQGPPLTFEELTEEQISIIANAKLTWHSFGQ